MRCWAVTVPAAQFADERLYAFERLSVPASDPEPASSDGSAVVPRTGEPVALLVAGGPPRLFGLGQVEDAGSVGIAVRYTRRLFDHPVPVADILGDRTEPGTGMGEPGGPRLVRLDPDRYARLARLAGAGPANRSEWFVSVALPIEAESQAEAVREFWTHVAKLGARELPAYVWPRGDELAMQAFVLGEEANLDPEED